MALMTFVGNDPDHPAHCACCPSPAPPPAVATTQLDALGRFAGGVAHDINNMLFGINGFIDLALAQEIDAEARRHLRNASETLDHSVGDDTTVLAFSRGQAVELQPLSLSGAVGETRHSSSRWPATSA